MNTGLCRCWWYSSAAKAGGHDGHGNDNDDDDNDNDDDDDDDDGDNDDDVDDDSHIAGHPRQKQEEGESLKAKDCLNKLSIKIQDSRVQCGW